MLISAAIQLNRFLTATFSTSTSLEDIPELVYGGLHNIVREDMNLTIAKWFLNTIYWSKPQHDGITKIALTYGVRDAIAKLQLADSDDEVLRLTQTISDLIWDLLPEANDRRRTIVNSNDRDKLLQKCFGRCAICGFVFPKESKDKLLGIAKALPPKRKNSDFLKPVQSKPEHMLIEIDHIFPFASGGSNNLSNLQLLCSYCNQAKKDYLSIFDVGYIKPTLFLHPNGNKISLPRKFHAVRILRDNQCFQCGRRAAETELTVFLRTLDAEANPINLGVSCYDHDPLNAIGLRFVESSVVTNNQRG